MVMKRKIIIGTVVAAVVVACCCVAFCGRDKHEISYETAIVGEGNISNSVTATGTIEPVTSVDVGTQVSGIVAKLYVDYNSVVKKGQVIAELDKTNLISQVNTAKASLNNAQSQLTYQKANYNRYSILYKKGLVSADEYETALLAYRQAQDEVKQRRESLQQAQTNLGYATITSPVDGVVLSREVEEGQTVAASFETPTLFTIAQDLTDMRVIADVDEADIGEVREGERVTFTVDAYPDDTFNGTVTQVRQEGNTEDNVVTFEVVISAPNKDLKLKPGLTANVTIYTLDKQNVLSVPNKALRFTPTKELIGDAEQQALILTRKDAEIGGEYTLASAKVAGVAPLQWHNLKLRFNGDQLTGYVDGGEVVSTVSGHYGKGMAGLMAPMQKLRVSTPYFDNLKITPVGQELSTPAQALDIEPLYPETEK